MGLFSKKEKIPSIQPSASLPELPPLPGKEIQAKKDLPELPSFPKTSKNENINREMVKSAVSDETSKNKTRQPISLPKMPKPQEKKENLLSSNPKITKKIPEIPRQTIPQKAKESEYAKHDEPVFVRIDKFQSAQKNFDEIKEKVSEIESVLNKIKKVKEQEEKEIAGWTTDTEQLKSKLAEIDQDIFSQL